MTAPPLLSCVNHLSEKSYDERRSRPPPHSPPRILPPSPYSFPSGSLLSPPPRDPLLFPPPSPTALLAAATAPFTAVAAPLAALAITVRTTFFAVLRRSGERRF